VSLLSCEWDFTSASQVKSTLVTRLMCLGYQNRCVIKRWNFFSISVKDLVF